MTTTSTLTDSLEIADKVLRLLFEAAVVRRAVKTGIGWRLEFKIPPPMCRAIESDTLVLEEGCDERVRMSGQSIWTSAETEIERFMASVPGCAVASIDTDRAGQLEIRFDNSFELVLVPADFSPDWQWMITPTSQNAAEVLSIVSVHEESIWTRYPPALAKYL